jgi:hypothetical protein
MTNRPVEQKVRPELLGLVDPARAAQVAFSLIDRLQNHDAELQVAATALVFLATCKRLKAHPGTVMTTAGNIVKRCEADVVELRALRQYLQEEIID